MLFVIFLFVAKLVCLAVAEKSCNVVSMVEWAGEESHRKVELPRPINIAVIQHTVTSECNTDTECKSILKGTRFYHMKVLGFDDIGPSFLIGGNGKVYEGAGWTKVGAHTLGYNNKAVGISFIGDFRKKLPSPEALQAAKDLLACGVDNGYLFDDYHLVSHRQLSQTESPGQALHDLIKSWPHWMEG